MLRELLRNKAKIGLVLLLVLLLALVRAFEDRLFYDPFSLYFKGDYLNLPFPEYDGMQLFLGMTFRYWLNTFLSLAIIQVIFREIGLTKFSALLYLIFYTILIIALMLLLQFSDSSNNFALFYVRRFLIQPILLLLFVPAFFYQRQHTKK